MRWQDGRLCCVINKERKKDRKKPREDSTVGEAVVGVEVSGGSEAPAGSSSLDHSHLPWAYSPFSLLSDRHQKYSLL